MPSWPGLSDKTGHDGWRAIRALLIVGLGTSVVPLDSSVNIDFPAITAHFHLPIPAIQWVVIAYVLTQTSLLLTFGRVGDMFGYRRIFLVGTGISTGAFAACALSPTYGWLLAGRVGQGIGAGLILSCGPALATSLFPETMRPVVLARYMMMFGFAGALGPSVFGVLVDHFGWSAVWAFRAPIAAAAFLLGWTIPAATPQARRERFDAQGGALLALGLSFLLLAVNRARDVPLLAAGCAVIAAAAFVLFYRQEHRAPQPIIDFGHFRVPGFASINVAHAGLNLAAFSIMLLAPFYLARIPGLSLPAAGLVLATSPVGIILAAPVAGRLASKVPPRRTAVVGLGLSGAGLIAISLSGPDPVLVLLGLSMALQGFGVGLFQVAYLDIVTASIPVANRGVAGALGMATRTIGTVTGATVLMLIFQTLRVGEFMPAFQWTFRIAALLPLGLMLWEARRLKGRTRG